MIQSMADKDYQVIKLAVMGEVKQHFRPEFINRIDEIVVFHALDEANIASIARVQLRELEKRVRSMDMEIEVSDAAVAELAKAGFDPVYGARPLKRAIQQQIENPLSKAILEGKFGPKDTIRVDAKGGVFSFDKGGLKRAA
jgi:ATP-dependent Clp protease ATP-binding subunit ClpB